MVLRGSSSTARRCEGSAPVGVAAQQVAHPQQAVIAGRQRVQLDQPGQHLPHRADPPAQQIRPAELMHRVGIVGVGGAGLGQQPNGLARLASAVGDLAHDRETLRRARVQLEGAAGTGLRLPQRRLLVAAEQNDRRPGVHRAQHPVQRLVGAHHGEPVLGERSGRRHPLGGIAGSTPAARAGSTRTRGCPRSAAPRSRGLPAATA